jgi:integrase
MSWENSFVPEYTGFPVYPQAVTCRARDNLMRQATNPAKQDIEDQLSRAEELDALDAILPINRREKLAELLTDDDVATLKHLAKHGLGANTMRALASDLAYLEAWALTATGRPLPWPAPEALLIKFVAHHLWDTHQQELDPSHGMPQEVSASLCESGLLRTNGPHAPATVRRRLSSWSTLTQWRGLDGAFNAPGLRAAIKLTVRASGRPRSRKSQKAVTAQVLNVILKVMGSDRMVDVRDQALLLLAFASGGRRRSEVAALRVEDLIDEEPVRTEPSDPNSPLLPCLTLRLGRTKTAAADEDERVILIGKPVIALKSWLARAAITSGPLFRGIDRWGHVDRKGLDPQSVNLILKTRIKAAGLDPAAYSAHGLRSGFLTEAANRGISLPEAMQQSRHKSTAQAASYYNDAERKLGKAARLMS